MVQFKKEAKEAENGPFKTTVGRNIKNGTDALLS